MYSTHVISFDISALNEWELCKSRVVFWLGVFRVASYCALSKLTTIESKERMRAMKARREKIAAACSAGAAREKTTCCALSLSLSFFCQYFPFHLWLIHSIFVCLSSRVATATRTTISNKQ